MKRTLDADKEEWDIIDDGTDPTVITTTRTPKYDSDDTGYTNPVASRQPVRTSTVTKPSAERKRKYTTADLPRLLAVNPYTKEATSVRLAGCGLYDSSFSYRMKRGRGRPKGSKNKNKSISSSITSSGYSSRSVSTTSSSGGFSYRSSAESKERHKNRGPGRPKGSKNKQKIPVLASSDDLYPGRPAFTAYAPTRRGLGGGNRGVSVPASARKKWGTCQTNTKDECVISARATRSRTIFDHPQVFLPLKPKRTAASRPSPKLIAVRVGGKRCVVHGPEQSVKLDTALSSDGETPASPSPPLHPRRTTRGSSGSATPPKGGPAKRKPSASILDDFASPRKRRKVNSAGSRRTVLQN